MVHLVWPSICQKAEAAASGYGDTFFLDEVFVRIHCKQRYLWRAIDQDGEVVDILLQARRDGKAAKRFFKRFLKKCRNEPRKIVADKLGSYGVAHRELVPDTIHDTSQYANNRFTPTYSGKKTRDVPLQIYGAGSAILGDPCSRVQSI